MSTPPIASRSRRSGSGECGNGPRPGFGSLIRESGRHDCIVFRVSSFRSDRVGPGQDLVDAGVGCRPHDELAAPDPDGPDQGTRGDQPFFRQAVEPSAVEVDQARRPQGRQRPAHLADQVIKPPARVRRPRSPRARAASGRRAWPRASCGHRWTASATARGSRRKSARRNFRPRSVDCSKAPPEARHQAEHRQQSDQAARRDEHLGDQQEQAQGEQQKRPSQRTHDSPSLGRRGDARQVVNSDVPLSSGTIPSCSVRHAEPGVNRLLNKHSLWDCGSLLGMGRTINPSSDDRDRGRAAGSTPSPGPGPSSSPPPLAEGWLRRPAA